MVLRRFAFRLALFLLPWIIILVVPQFRTQFWATVKGDHLTANPNPWVGFLNPSGRDWTMPAPTTLEQKALDIPGGTGIDGVSIINTPKGRDRGYWKAFEYGRFSDQHPQAAWLVATALKNIDSHSDGRVEYEFAASPSFRQPERLVNKLKPEMVQEAMRLVRRGQQLEPDNAFFDWMEIRFLLIKKQDREALELLGKAANKPRYDEHLRSAMAAHITDFESRRALLPDERLGTVWSVLLPELSVYRHMRGTIQWRIDQLEQNNRHEEAIALGTALRRFFTMQMRATPFSINSQTAADGLYAVWRGGNRKLTSSERARLASSETGNWLNSYNPRRNQFVAQRYFQYLSDHGRRDLIPEAKAQFQIYQVASPGPDGPRVDDFMNPNRNGPLTFSNLLWAGGGLALVGVILSGGLYLLLQPIGFRSRLRPSTPSPWMPSRRVFYPQLIAWAGAAICTGYAAHGQLLANLEPVYCGNNDTQMSDPHMRLTIAALALPFAAALFTQLLNVRDSVPKTAENNHWIPNLQELGISEELIPIYMRSWRAFCGILILLGLLSVPFTILHFFGMQLESWGFPTKWDVFDLRLTVMSLDFVPFIAPFLAAVWLVFITARWLMNLGGADHSAVFAAIGSYRRYCGAYSIVFSWLVLLAFVCNTPLERELDRGFQEYLGLEEKLAQVGTVGPKPAPITLKTLPPIPVFPTPTPVPFIATSNMPPALGEAPPP